MLPIRMRLFNNSSMMYWTSIVVRSVWLRIMCTLIYSTCIWWWVGDTFTNVFLQWNPWNYCWLHGVCKWFVNAFEDFIYRYGAPLESTLINPQAEIRTKGRVKPISNLTTLSNVNTKSSYLLIILLPFPA